MHQIQTQQPDLMETVIRGATVLCNYIIEFHKLELEAAKLKAEFEIETQKISAAERVALEDIQMKKAILTKNLEITSVELKHLALNKDILYKALNALVEKIIADDTEDKSIFLRAIELIREEISCLREESALHFDRITHQTLKSLESSSGKLILEGGDDFEQE